jgi:mannan endo-1,4-beta-mannosidase
MRRLAVLAATMLACVVPATAQAKVQFGLSTDTPGEFAAVQRQMHVDLDAPFVGFKAAPDFTYYLTRAKAYGVRAMITWEPWDGRTGKTPGVSTRDIAKGKADAYLKRQARVAKAYRKPIYVRLAHEMNGSWYPWGKDPKAYRAAWVHIVQLFRKAGAKNVKWIWSPNLNTYESDAKFDRNVKQYWPGGKYVDLVGTTVNRQLIQGTFYQTPEWFFTRFDRLMSFNKPMWITESNVALEDMPRWMPLFQQAMLARPWIKGLVWLDTQTPQNPKFGNVTWKLSEQPAVRQYLRF